MNSFVRDGGDTIRMYGVLNALSKHGHEVVFISNTKETKKFHTNIKHIYIGQELSHGQKRVFHFLLGLFSLNITYYLFAKLFRNIVKAIKKACAFSDSDKVYFFDYLDNSIGYVLKKKGVIKTAVNDIHGIATLEFSYPIKKTTNLVKLFVYILKYKTASKLDKKVFSEVDELIYASKQMKIYLEDLYPLNKIKKSYVLPNLISSEALNTKIDLVKLQQLKNNYQLDDVDFTIFFAGGYKRTAGIEDLINVFNRLKIAYPQKKMKLLLIGNGPTYESCYKQIKNLKIEGDVIMIQRIPYNELRTYQNLANVIVNPDRQNPYSELIVHLKYFDALVSDILVVNPRFSSVVEINGKDKLSLTYRPSDLNDLFGTIEQCLLYNDDLLKKYSKTRSYTSKNLTYDSVIDTLLG